MDHQFIIRQLEANAEVIRAFYQNLTKEQQLWKPAQEKWCLLEVICHLRDEEQEDFRARVKHVLEQPENLFTSIDPQEWVHSRKYMEQDLETVLNEFLSERAASIKWLDGPLHPNWKSTHHHPKAGPVTAEFLLANWLAHDYLHIRQINRLKYQYLETIQPKLDYAGEW